MITGAGIRLTDGYWHTGTADKVTRESRPELETPGGHLRRAADLLIIRDRPELPVADWSSRIRGTILHEALRHIVRLPVNWQADADQLVQRALTRAAAALGMEETSWKRMELDILLRDWLERLSFWLTAPAQNWTEKEFVGPSGELVRLDRLVHREGEWTIVDYKTGLPDDHHPRQVNRYRRVLKTLGIEAAGKLVYLDQGEIRDVE